MRDMEVSVRMLAGVDILEVSGMATVDGHQLLKRRFQAAVHRGRNQFILNLSHLVSVDSLTIGEMVACVKRARERDGDVRLVVASGGAVHEILQLTGLERIFRIYGDEFEAAASYSNGQT